MTSILLQLLELTVSMSALIAFILLFFKLFGKRFTAKCKYIVWTIVIIRLCLPVGILGITPLFEIKVPSTQSAVVNTPTTEANGDNVPQAEAPSAQSTDINAQTSTVTPDITPKPTPTPSEPDTPALPSDILIKNDNSSTSANIRQDTEKNKVQKNALTFSADMIPNVICAVWLTGALIFIGARLITYAVYTRRMKKLGILQEPSEEASAEYQALCQKLSIKHPPKLFVSRIPVSPHLCGYVKRKVIIPDMTYAMHDLKGILTHELTHCKRGDLYVKLACTVAQAVSWFNPLVHLAAGRCISEMELSCDESVLKNSSEEERILYGNLVLDIVRRCGHVKGSYLTSSFKPKYGAVKERIMNIIGNEKKKKGIVIIAVALALCITAGTIIGCSVATNKNDEGAADTPTASPVPWEKENTSETGNFIGSNVTDETSSRESWYLENNVKTKEAELVEAFLTNDTLTLGTIIRATIGAYERSYMDMKIGRYRIVFDPEDKEKYENPDNYMSALKVDVEILESGNEVLTPGIHRLVPSFTPYGTSFIIENENTQKTDGFSVTDRTDGIATALLNQNITSMDDVRNIAASADTQAMTTLVLGCIKYYTDIDQLNEKLSYSRVPGFSEEEIAECAEKYFDVANLVPVSGTPEEMDDFKYMLYEDGLYRMRKGLNPENNVLLTCESSEGQGTVTTTVTVWADLSKTIKSSMYEYKFELSGKNPKLTDAKLLEDSAFLPLELHGMYAFPNINVYQFAEAFIDCDVSECARLYYGDYSMETSPELESMFTPLTTLEFSSHKIRREFNENNYEVVKMTFTISESGYDLFPVGDYEVTVYDAGPERIKCDWKKPNDYTVPDEYSKAVDFINVLLPYMVDGDFSPEIYLSNNWSHEGITLNIYKELSKVTGMPAYEIKLTPEEMKSAAYELYGIEDFEPHERNAQFWEEIGQYELPGHGGDCCYCDVININKTDDIYEIDVQYYADTLCFGRSNVVRYTLRETDSRFDYRLEKTEIIEAGNPPRIVNI